MSDDLDFAVWGQGRIQFECGVLSEMLSLPGGVRVVDVEPGGPYGAYVTLIIAGEGLAPVDNGVDIPLYVLTLTRIESTLEKWVR